jgi:hypothetical protein
MLRPYFLVVPFLALFACGSGNTRSNTDGGLLDGASPDAPVLSNCKSNDDCSSPSGVEPIGGTPVCDLTRSGGTCVQCTATDHSLCTGSTPVCANDVCVGCTKHTDCLESNTCLPDGSCAQSSEVAYVDGAGTDNAECTKTNPCSKLATAAAVKTIVKVSGTVTNRTQLDDVTATILGDPGAKLMPQASDSGTILDVGGSSDVRVYDLQISNANGPGGTGVLINANLELTRVIIRDNAGNGAQITSGQLTCTQCLIENNGLHGIDSATSGTLTVSQSIIRNNMSGGISISDDVSFRIIGNIIFGNGKTTRSNGGGLNITVNIPTAGVPANELRFNSLSRNRNAELGQGINCSNNGNVVVMTSNNIVWDNGDDPTSALQVAGSNCNYSFSDIGPVGIDSNLSVDPMFQDEIAGDLHLTNGSPLVRGADPNADLTGLAARDINGDLRVAPADIGADQVPRP